MQIELITQPITRSYVSEKAKQLFGDMVKAVVDIEKGVMVIGGELHADEEAFLLERGSAQQHLWGINLYPDVQDASWIEFDSMINIRPSQQNRSRSVESTELREKIVNIVTKLIPSGE